MLIPFEDRPFQLNDSVHRTNLWYVFQHEVRDPSLHLLRLRQAFFCFLLLLLVPLALLGLLPLVEGVEVEEAEVQDDEMDPTYLDTSLFVICRLQFLDLSTFYR